MDQSQFHEGLSYKDVFTLLWENASTSPDPSTQNAAGIWVDRGQSSGLHVGVNYFPEGWEPEDRDFERPRKYDLIEHAERNAIYSAAEDGDSTSGRTMFALWAACPDCARAIVQSGISNLIVYKPISKLTPQRWQDKVELGIKILLDGGVRISAFSEPLDDSGLLRFDGKDLWWSNGRLQIEEPTSGAY